MNHERQQSTRPADARPCVPTTTATVLHDDHQPSFGRWLGQINGHR
ncbi:hypothetical protein [Curtobacterium sp. ISL-83]|nr:hypothetical protein [Curtobacterium sp. ISL-83]MBT2503855.1 hypothetical protein [Curtobacterium sp. ISL-83]